MILLWVSLLMFPACAGASAVLVGVIHRREELEDGPLLRQFMFFLIIGTVSVSTIVQRPSVQRHLNPELQLQADVEADPVYKALGHVDSGYAAQYQALLTRDGTTSATLPEERLKARSMLTTLATARLGFADQATHIAWGHLTADSLREMEARSPEQCYAAISGQALDKDTLAHGFSARNSAESVLVQVLLESPRLETSGKGLGHVIPNSDRPADFNATMVEYSGIQDDVAKRYGPEVGALLTSKRFPKSPPLSADTICAARIYQLESMLERPKATAALLVDSALR